MLGEWELKRERAACVLVKWRQDADRITPTGMYTISSVNLAHLKTQRLDEFFNTLSVFFANIPNNITLAKEKYYQSLCFAVFKLIGLNTNAEVNTNIVRLDCVIEMDETIYIIKFKLDGTKEQALQQIIDNKYAQAFQLSDKKVILIGAEFDKQGRNIAGVVSQSANTS